MGRTTSEAQRGAARANGAKSRGPRTPDGKARSSANAIRHGLTAQHVVLADEDEAEFCKFGACMFDDLEPAGALEEFLAERVVAAAWRLRRTARVEAEALDDARENSTGAPASLGLGFVRAVASTEALAVLGRYEAGLERALLRAVHELQRLQAIRGGPRLAPAAMADADDESITRDDPDADDQALDE